MSTSLLPRVSARCGRLARVAWLVAGGLFLVANSGTYADDEEDKPAPEPRTSFVINPNTPVRRLLPAAPKKVKSPGPVLTDDLTKVPEVSFGQALKLSGPATPQANVAAIESVALTRSRILHLNKKHPDAFMVALLARRSDLSGLPVVMGDDCRLPSGRRDHFGTAVSHVQAALQPSAETFGFLDPFGLSPLREDPRKAPDDFWRRYAELLHTQGEPSLAGGADGSDEHITPARIAALIQILGPAPAARRVGLAKYLANVPHADSTKALAKLATFAPEDEVRRVAVKALKVRRESELLRQGLRYPYPAVAKRTAEALIALQRVDFVPELVALLDEPDPRAPSAESGKPPTVRELVRINHHRNCFLCHAPGEFASDALFAPVPIPSQSLPLPGAYYGGDGAEIVVRFDVTYLRQDFSLLQPVADADPWPELQRFDFLVRRRVLSPEEAQVYRAALELKEPGILSPYHRAALAALRELTGRDTAPTATAWRELLGMTKR
jgi:hypothetical protein